MDRQGDFSKATVWVFATFLFSQETDDANDFQGYEYSDTQTEESGTDCHILTRMEAISEKRF